MTITGSQSNTTDLGGMEGGDAGDIVTTRKFATYELSVHFRITSGANSGILYLVALNLKKVPARLSAPSTRSVSFRNIKIRELPSTTAK